jgi:hypothetical protein
MTALTEGLRNTGIGRMAMKSLTTGDDNTSIGNGSGEFLTTGDSNTLLAGGAALTTASNNVMVGRQAGNNTQEGHSNTLVGTGAGFNVTSGDNNLILGFEAGITGSPGGQISTQNSTISLGDENIGEANIQVDWSVASDQRDKTDFTALDLGLDFVNDLKPVTYKWDKRSKYGDKHADDYDLNTITHDGTHKEDWLDIGFKAQEVEVLEAAAGYKIADKTNLTTKLSGDGKQYGIQYTKFIPILVKAIQELSAEIEILKAK